MQITHVGELEVLFHGPAQARGPDQGGSSGRLALGHEAEVECQLAGAQVADEQAGAASMR